MIFIEFWEKDKVSEATIEMGVTTIHFVGKPIAQEQFYTSESLDMETWMQEMLQLYPDALVYIWEDEPTK